MISSPNGMGCLDMTDPLSLGFIGRNGAYPANQAGRHADVVMAIGARFDDRSASSWLPGYSWNFPHSKLIHVDVDHRRARPQLSARPRASSPTRAPSCASCWPSWSAARAKRGDALEGLARRHRELAARSGRRSRGPNFDIHATPIRPERVVADCQAVLPDDAILACDVGVNHNWYMQFWKARRPQTMLNSWGFSGMGFGAAGVLGAKLAAPDRPCVAIAGDGCFTMVPHVLCTAVEYDIPVVWVIWNNFGWVSIRDIQLGMFGGRELGTMFHAGRQQDALQSRLRRLGQAPAASTRMTVTKSEDFKGALEHAVKRQQAVPARRACRRRRAPAGDRHLAAAADALQGARIRQGLGAGLDGAGEVGFVEAGSHDQADRGCRCRSDAGGGVRSRTCGKLGARLHPDSARGEAGLHPDQAGQAGSLRHPVCRRPWRARAQVGVVDELGSRKLSGPQPGQVRRARVPGGGGRCALRQAGGHERDLQDGRPACGRHLAVAAYLKKQSDLPVWLVGTSMGTFSAAGGAIAGKGVDGLVLTSTITRAQPYWKIKDSHPDGVASMALAKVSVPTLIVSHRKDGCDITPADDAPKLSKALKSARKVETVLLDGGAPPRSKPCQAMSQHGFLGIENAAVDAIAKFIKAGRP